MINVIHFRIYAIFHHYAHINFGNNLIKHQR